MPVPITEICRALQIELKRRNTVGRFKSYLTVDPAAPDRATILLPAATLAAEPWQNSKFERLCIAHELAHFFLLKRYNLSPQTNSEYWQHEDLCDDFARHVLLPGAFLASRVEGIPRKLSAYLTLCDELEGIAKLPWIHVGIRIGELGHGIAYFKCAPERRDGELVYVITTTSLPRRQGVRFAIKKTMPLYEQLTAMFAEAETRGCPIRYNITQAMNATKGKQKKSVLMKLSLPAGSISVAEAVNGTQPELKIVVAFRAAIPSLTGERC